MYLQWKYMGCVLGRVMPLDRAAHSLLPFWCPGHWSPFSSGPLLCGWTVTNHTHSSGPSVPHRAQGNSDKGKMAVKLGWSQEWREHQADPSSARVLEYICWCVYPLRSPPSLLFLASPLSFRCQCCWWFVGTIGSSYSGSDGSSLPDSVVSLWLVFV